MRALRPNRRRQPPIRTEDGSATVLVLAFAMALVLLATALATGVALAGSGQRARTAADLAALAVADHTGQVSGGLVGTGLVGTGLMGTGQPDACGLGERVAAANGARLVACRADSSRSRVEVAISLPWGGEVRRVAEAVPGG
jgi:hypothetical protein